MPIRDLQKRSRELGRIRLGQKGDRGQPQKLDRFRFTGHSQALIEKIAELYGGEPRQWTPAGGVPQWEVISNATRVPIMVPPQPVSQWYEAWRKSGCVHRCDGHTNVLTDEPCDPEDPIHREALDKPTTRLNVVLRDVEGIGVWRVETHGWNAAIELPDVAEFLAQAGGYVNGWLSLEQRTSVAQTDSGPQTRHYIVPIIEVDVTPAQLMAGHGRVQAPALDGPASATPALEAADPFGPYFERLAAASSLEDLQELWTGMVAEKLVGKASTPSQRGAEFVEAYRAKAQEVQSSVQAAPAAAGPVPDADGAVDAELVDDPEAEAAEADLLWQQILTVAGQQGMSLPEVQEDFASRNGGVVPGSASSAELAVYLEALKARAAA